MQQRLFFLLRHTVAGTIIRINGVWVISLIDKKFHLMRVLLRLLISLALLSLCKSCAHPIFCEGEVLKAVQLSGLFPDSKTFVDMPLKYDVDVVLQNFKKQPLDQFVAQNFLDPESVLAEASLPDWKAKPEQFNFISDPKLKEFAYALHAKWKGLAKKFSLTQLSKVSSCKANCTTILEVMNERTFIAPGGRFRECYYWDTYWIVKGLIHSDMLDTAEAVIRNFFEVIKAYGFVPNGMRLYYLNRSQPPLLALMVQDLAYEYRMRFQSLKAIKLQQDAIPILIKEHTYWMTTHSRNVTVKGRTHAVNFYSANTTDPRPESYKEDYQLTQNMTQSQRASLLKNIASAAESGWDFSSRWFADSHNLNTTRTTEINPSDLNAFMGLAEQAIANMARSQGNASIYSEYTKYLNDRKIYFSSIEQQGLYPDYPEQKQFYASWLLPLVLLQKESNYKFKEVVSPPTSFLESGQQWDYPNVWAPLVWALVQTTPVQSQLEVAQKWIDTTYCGWRKYGAMFEKYHAEKLGERGSGGEYTPQEGFGWTNGLTLELLLSYGSDLTARDC